ncbi:hypothetical protein VNO78_12327 [Psophocarpus tetragonolobus]|uniref:Protein kinase domain-containing protein n=1 Tax=Psophocarpus tetragonolobus TaxID=3891 RepID=A0AAN9SQR9_PSOTE
MDGFKGASSQGKILVKRLETQCVFRGEDYYGEFGGAKFVLTISPAFANLTHLRNLYLNDNNLVGSIPGSFLNLSQLLHLDVSNNNLSGDVSKFSTKVKFFNALLGRGRNGTTSSTVVKQPNGSLNVSSSNISVSLALTEGGVTLVVFFVAMVLFVFRMCHIKNQLWKLGIRMQYDAMGSNDCAPLTLKQRVTIAMDVVTGVEYLHNLAQQSFIHRDIE